MSNNYKVIGASDRNLKALSLAHTIGGSKTVAGYAKADLKFNEDAVPYTPEAYPFKMSILFDKETEEYKLNIVQGRVQITDSGQDRCYVVNFDENAIPLDSLSEDGVYGVELLVQYDPYGIAEDGGTDNAYFPYFIYFLPEEATTHDAVHTRGVFTIPLGKIKKETVEENVSYSLTQQIIGDFTYSFQACNHPFSITAITNAISTGDLKSSWTLSDFEFNVMSGSVIVEQTIVGVPQDTFSASTDTFIYCVVSEDETAVLSAATKEVPFFNGTDESGYSSWNYLIGKIYNDDYSGVKIDQYIHSNFGTNGSANKVKSIEADGEADYLSGKLKFQEVTDKKEFSLSGYENGLIGGDLVSTQISVEGSDVKLTRYDIKPIWLYKEIFDFKDDKAQVLSHDNTGKLEWIPGYEIELTGSLKDWMQIEEISGSQYLRWRPEFDLEETAPGEEYLPFYFMSSVKKKKNDKLDKTQVLSGLSFGIDEEKINGIMSWDFLSGYPKCETPPPSSDVTSAWVFAGCKENGLSWTPLSALSGNLTVSGSLEYDFEVVNTTSGQVLRWYEEFSEEDKTPFNYFLGQNGEDATFDKWTFLQEENEKASLFSWEYNEEGIGDVYLYTPPNKTEEISSYVLVGSAEEGFSWEPWITSDIELSGSIENIFELVIDEETSKKILRVVTEFDETFEEFHWVCLNDDGTLDYFNFEGEPEDVGVESIQIWDHEAKEPFVMYTPDYKEDDIYLLGGDKENGLHWTPMFETISGELYIVATDESDDQPSYLYDKLFSTSGSILVDLDASEGYSTVNLEINPDYFFSSDESIAIEATEEGIDFTVSSYLVQVSEGDLPEYLADKITSASGSLIVDIGENGEGQTVNLEINPDYFFSSDESIAIEATEEGIDFTVSSYLVQVSEGDLPEYLSDKITSASGSLIVDIGENGEGQTVNLEINPDYFYSSEGSISIEATEDGLDFNLSSYLVQVNEGDLPGYLIDKITSASGSLIIEQGEDGEQMTVNAEINPEYFYSSEGSISIEATDEGLDFNLSSYFVQVTEGDLPEYLADKITSASGSLIVDIGENGEGQTVNLEINPDYFFSSDGTVAIEATDEGLDFTLSSAVVSVTEDDLPQFLSDKITSASGSLVVDIGENGEGQTVNLEINPEYFYSSDGSIAIEAADGGLDFTLSSAVVSVTEGDLPQFLSDKITSASGSLIVDIGENGEGQTVNLEINPEYFFSSDGTIGIEATETGLDFTISSAVVSVTEEDLPQFLSDKITSASGSLIVDIGENGEGQTVNLEINPEYFFSSDGKIGIEATDNGIDFTLSSAVVSATETDTEPDTLDKKITSPNGTIVITPNNATLDIDLNTDIFTSNDDTVQITPSESGVDFSVEGLFKVKLSQGDDSPDFLASKLDVKAPLKIENSGGKLVISLNLPQGDGLLKISSSGELSIISIGNGVAVGNGSTLSFEEPEECQ